MISKKWTPTEPFNGLPPPPATDALMTPAVTKAEARCEEAIAEATGASHAELTRTALWRAIPMADAIASSAIEGVHTNPEKMIRAKGSAKRDWETQTAIRTEAETVRCWTDGQIGWNWTYEGSRIASRILNMNTPVRTTRVYIGGGGRILYTPPTGRDELRHMLEQLWTYLNNSEPGSLARIAAAHYQFESIHPFEDGNGRTGRALISGGLRALGHAQNPITAPSVFVWNNRRAYYAGFEKVRSDQDWESWTVMLLQAIETGARRTTAAITELSGRAADAATSTDLPAEVVRQAWMLPYLRNTDLMKTGAFENAAQARKAAKKLIDDGTLKQVPVKGRLLYSNPETVAAWHARL